MDINDALKKKEIPSGGEHKQVQLETDESGRVPLAVVIDGVKFDLVKPPNMSAGPIVKLTFTDGVLTVDTRTVDPTLVKMLYNTGIGIDNLKSFIDSLATFVNVVGPILCAALEMIPGNAIGMTVKVSPSCELDFGIRKRTPD